MSKAILSQEVRDQRELERVAEFKVAVIISAERLIGPLFPFFWLADVLYNPADKWLFLPLRLSVLFYCFGLSYFAKKENSIKVLQRYAFALLTYPSLLVTFMCLKGSGISSSYYAGLNLIAAGAIYFFPWSRSFAFSVVGLIFIPYLASPLYMDWKKDDFKLYIVNLFFIAGTVMISSVVRSIYESLKREEVKTKVDLKNEIEHRNQIIETKTNEAIKLSTLAKQFSPQVVHAITSGKLEIMNSLKRTKICTLFIDIVNSTDRITRIDQDSLDSVLRMFMEDTMRVLLKYDITIDKFLGDGVLAFSNAPISRDDYIIRVVDAAVEIRNRIILNREKYLEHWLNELQIRVGIASGFANVGFYGSEEYFRSYTAIGKVVNMASRLCNAAEPSEILISKDIAQDPEVASKYKIDNLGYKKLKGFEQDIINVYSVIDNIDSQVNNHDIPTCPEGHGILHFDTDEKGIYHLKCRSCNFVLTNVQTTQRKKSA